MYHLNRSNGKAPRLLGILTLSSRGRGAGEHVNLIYQEFKAGAVSEQMTNGRLFTFFSLVTPIHGQSIFDEQKICLMWRMHRTV
jgi:hypothetical protein